MPVIKAVQQFHAALNQGFEHIRAEYKHKNSEEVFHFLEGVIGRCARTIGNWRYVKKGKLLDDELCYGFAWIVMSRGKASLSWLVDFFSATTAIVVQPPSKEWVRACFRMAWHQTEQAGFRYPTDEEIETVVQRCFNSADVSPAPAEILPKWTYRALSVLRLIESAPDRPAPQSPMERYWDGLPRRDMPLHYIDNEYPFLRDVLAQLCQKQVFDMQVDMTLLLIHYMYARFLLEDRLTYVYSAIDAAQHLPNRRDSLWFKAMLHIDGAGWILIEQGRDATALNQIEMGLQIAAELEPKAETGSYDLTVLGYAYKALLLSTPANVKQAQAYLDRVQDLPCHPAVRSRFYQVVLKAAALQQNHDAVRQAHYVGMNYGSKAPGIITQVSLSIHSAEAYLHLKQPQKAQKFLQLAQETNPEGVLSLPWYIKTQTLLARIALAGHHRQQAHQHLQELFRVLEEKQKAHVESRLLQDARRLYDEIRRIPVP